MASCVSLSLSPMVSRAPLLVSSPEKLTCPGRKDLLQFLERRRIQYLVKQQAQVEHAVTASSTSSCETKQSMDFEIEPARLAEHIIYRAKTNMKIKKRRKTKESIIHVQPKEPHVKQTNLISLAPSTCTVRKTYYGPLYHQVQKEWRETLINRHTPKIAKVKRVLNFEKATAYTEEQRVIIICRPSSISTTTTTTTTTRHNYIQNNSEEYIQRERKKKTEELHVVLKKTKQRSEIYALNMLMRELEEKSFKDSIAIVGEKV